MTKTLVNAYDIQHYLRFTGDGGEKYVRVTETNSFEASRENETYTTAYLDRKNQTDYVTATKDSFEFEVDMVGPDGIQKDLYLHEDDVNVPVEYVRTLAYDFAAGAPCPASALKAKRRSGVLNMSPIAQEAGSPLTMTGSVSLEGEWERGTFDPATGEFSAAAPE